MTEVIILKQGSKKKKELTPIKFLYQTDGDRNSGVYAAKTKPNRFKFIELICPAPNSDFYDIMFAYNDCRKDGFIFYGNFNDGVVDENE